MLLRVVPTSQKPLMRREEHWRLRLFGGESWSEGVGMDSGTLGLVVRGGPQASGRVC